MLWLVRRPGAEMVAEHTPSGTYDFQKNIAYSTDTDVTWPNLVNYDTHGYASRSTTLEVPTGLTGIYLVWCWYSIEYDISNSPPTDADSYARLRVVVNDADNVDGVGLCGNIVSLPTAAPNSGDNSRLPMKCTGIARLEEGDKLAAEIYLYSTDGDGWRHPADSIGELQFGLRWLAYG